MQRRKFLNIWVRTAKLAFVFIIATIISMVVQLENATAAGIIGLLTILDTRTATLEKSWAYLVATLLAFIISSIFYTLIGFNVLTIGAYLVVFVPLAYKLEVHSVIAPVTVLVTHFLLVESIGWRWQINEFLLMVVGVSVALVINLWMPSQDKTIEQLKQAIESQMRKILAMMAHRLTHPEIIHADVKNQLSILDKTLGQFEQLSLLDYDNQLFSKNPYYIVYYQMRREQYHLLKQMETVLPQIELKMEYNTILSSIFVQTAAELDEQNTGQVLLENIAHLFNVFRKSELPTTRKEFENRAVLYQLLLTFERFLEAKYDFYQKYGEEMD